MRENNLKGEMMNMDHRLIEIDEVISALAQEIIRRSEGDSGHSAHVEAFATLLEERRFYFSAVDMYIPPKKHSGDQNFTGDLP
jgi:hypothetical protein